MILLPKDSWEIKNTNKKGRGIFAKRDIPPGTVVGDYIGKVIKTAEEDIYEKDEALYLMYYHDRASIYPEDHKAPGIHLLNHSCTPNCWMYTYRGHTLFFAIRHLFKGEEITISYLLPPQDEFCNPCNDICHCNGLICHGTMHLTDTKYDKWDDFNDKEAKKTKKARVTYGKVLPRLASYPDSIPDDPIYDLFGSAQESPLKLDVKEVPDVTKIRELIREKGRTITIPTLKMRILGVCDDIVISEPIK